MLLRYRSGEEIKKGDRVLFHRNPAEIELVTADPADPSDPQAQSFVQEYGGGVMVLDPHVSVRTFIPTGQLAVYEDLEFVSRAGI